MSNQADEKKIVQNKWSTYASEVFMSRKPPQALGTVVHSEIEKRAKEKLKDYPGKFSCWRNGEPMQLYKMILPRKFHVR